LLQKKLDKSAQERAEHLHQGKMALLLTDAKRSLGVNIAAVLVFVLTLKSSLSSSILDNWLSIMIFTLVLRCVFCALVEQPKFKAKFSTYSWVKLYLVLIFASGALWGWTIFFWQPVMPPATQLLLLLFPLAMSAGAVSTFGVWLPAYVGFLLPCLLPTIAMLLFAHDSQYWGTSIAAGFYLSALLLLGVSYQSRIKEVLLLKFGNAKLVEDLSEQNVLLRSAKEEAEAANVVKSEFLARMSHELRTPMNGVLGSTQVLHTTALNAQQTKLCDNVHGSAQSLLLIIDEVLEFAELDAETIHLANDTFNARELISQVVAESDFKAQRKGLILRSRCTDDVPQYLHGDAARLKKVLRNLVDNAIKFTQLGKVEVVLSLEGQSDSQSQLKFSVSDSGSGIKSSDQSTIFESFTQADNTSTRGYGGVGLGLTVAQRWVNLMGGNIALESELGKGSTFYFSVWLGQANAFDDLPVTDTFSLEGTKILVVEDSEINQAVVEALLENMGCKVTIVENGLEAVNIVSEEKFELVLMDCQMPVMDGYEATKEIRNLDVGSDITILALTANAMPGDREKCLQAGMDDYITKPFDAGELERIISQNLNSIDPAQLVDIKSGSMHIMTTDNNGKVLDSAALENLRMLDKGKGLICRVIDAFNKSIPALMSDLETGIAEQDIENIRIPSHTMKSSAANLGALAFSKQCAVIESMAREGDISGVEAEFATLKNLLVPVQQELNEEKAQAEARKAA